MKKESFSIRLPEDVKNKLELVADATGRTKSYIAVEAINNFCDIQSWQIEAIKEGIKSAEKGEFYSTEEVLSHLENKGGK